MSWALTWRSNPAYKALQKYEDSLIETLFNWKPACVAGVRKGTWIKRRTPFIRTPSRALRASLRPKAPSPFHFECLPRRLTGIPTDTYKGNRPNPCCSQVVWKRINENSIISTFVFSQNRVSLLVCLDSTRDADVPFFRAHSKSAPSRSFCDPGPSTPPAVRSKSTFSLFPLVALYSPDPLNVLYTKLLSVHVIEASSLALKATATAKTPLFREKKSVPCRSRTFARHFLF